MFARPLRLNILDRQIQVGEVSPKAEGHNSRGTFVDGRVFYNPLNKISIVDRELDGEISPKAEGKSNRKAMDDTSFSQGQMITINLKSSKN